MSGRISSLPAHQTFQSGVLGASDWKVALTGRLESLPYTGGNRANFGLRINLERAVQPRMANDGHGFTGGFVSDPLLPKGEPRQR
jgi:hypothetical protein